MFLVKRTVSRWLAIVLFLSLLMPAILSVPVHALADVPKENLALNKAVSKSSECSTCGKAVSAVDGSATTYWQPLSSDRNDGQVWIQVDLGGVYSINEAVLNFAAASGVGDYTIQTSSNQTDWQDAIVKTVSSVTGKVETANFPDVSGRYVKLLISIANPGTNFQLKEFELYSSAPVPAFLDSVYITDTQGRTLGEYDTVSMTKGSPFQLMLAGKMSDGTPANLSSGAVAWESTNTGAVTVNVYGNVTALQEGVAKVTARATLEKVTKESSVWVDVYDPSTLLVNAQIDHPTMTSQIGQPALLQIGDVYPSVRLRSYVDGSVTASLVSVSTGNVITTLPSSTMNAGVEQVITIPGTVQGIGSYELRLQYQVPGKNPIYDTFTFTVQNQADIGPDESNIAYLGPDGKMVYAPDFRGNRIIDFSNAGYMGGGVKIPDVQARIAVEPGDGDDMARIQAAIDEVSLMPQSADGFRGAVLLKKGTYEISGTLYIRSSGVVLRGEGQGEDGSILYATGTAKRNILEIQGQAVNLLTDTATQVSDLYVPAGSSSFHVDNASGFQVGDKVKVRRYGNARWIHEIKMDTIFERDGTTQWAPFDLDFDRIITAINNNLVTIDAPIANAIERQWGGGEIIKYEDSDRLDQVGVENLRVDSEFNPNVTATNSGKIYFSDENHAVSFAVLSNVKNAWVREVTGLHLNHALVHVSRNAKWVTVQDNKSLDMVSVITGGNRYPYKMSGELTLMQRNYAETARHAFVVDSRVMGPNVFLDSQSVNEFATSEPHHRWSVGGLFDNVKADIAIQDRGLLGSGHGWSGANYVTWNTEGDLVSQQPPTAQNYAIGHVGTKVKGYLPNSDDKRPRSDAYWDHAGSHVNPSSLYLQQLRDRLSEQGVQNILQTPVGGGALDVPKLPQDLPLLKGIKINNKQMSGFSLNVFDYTVVLPLGTTNIPSIRPHDNRDDVEVIQATSLYGTTILNVRDKKNPLQSVRYNIRFTVSSTTSE